MSRPKARPLATSSWLLPIVFLAQAMPAQQASPQAVGQSLQTPLGTGSVARERAATREATTVLWVQYGDDLRRFREESDYLLDLQRRFRAKGLAVAVSMPPASAKALAKEGIDLLIVALDQGDGKAAYATSVTKGLTGPVRARVPRLDGVLDIVERCLQGDAEQPNIDALYRSLDSLVMNVADGGEFDPQIKACLEGLPHSGTAHACAVLNEWWCNGDLEAARKATRRAIDALRGESLPMIRFADLVLRGDRNDRQVATDVLLGLEPAVGSSSTPLAQLIHLRALLMAGQDRRAGRIAAKLPKQLEGKPVLQLVFAETLMEAAVPMVFRDAAEQAFAKAEDKGADRQWLYGTRHKILKRCGDDKAAEELAVKYRATGNNSLNNDAWYLMVRPATLGRFNTIALAQCEEMLRQEGANVDFNSVDTAALAFFLNGKIEEAVKMQTDVRKQGGTGTTYSARLRRYTESQALAKAQAAKDAAKKR
ncbi:MAG: hypothetical protein AB8H80_23585 [Planctomycetota bacterium]